MKQFNLGTSSSGASSPLPDLQWPPAGAIHLRPDLPIIGNDNAIEGVTVAPELVFAASGAGASVTRDGAGFHFDQGQYLSLTLPQATDYDGILAFARVTFLALDDTRIGQHPISISGGGTELLGVDLGRSTFSSDLGLATPNLGPKFTDAIPLNEPVTIGVHFDMRDRPYGGRHAIWYNQGFAGSRQAGQVVTATKWNLGQDAKVILHEGIVLFRYAGEDRPLLPPGWDAQSICDHLAA